ncbi:MAG: hypothetical protein U0172_05810 [Nitrospiraceae bacterium]
MTALRGIFTVLFVAAVPTLGFAAGCPTPADGQGATTGAYRVTGTVHAVATDQSPSTIVVQTGSSVDPVVIAASLERTTIVCRGAKRAALEQIRVGERVRVAYRKTAKGLVALSIDTK